MVGAEQPNQVVNEITQHFGLAEISEDAIAGYFAKKRKDERGRHRYSVDRYGIDRERVHSRFSEYIDRFQIPLRDG